MSENQKKEKIEFAKTSGDDESRPCWRYNFSLGGKELFSLQAVTIDENNIIHYIQDNNSRMPVQFILVPQGENFNQTNLEKYCNKVKGILSKRDGLRDKLDQEFVARILAAEPFTENGYINQLDLGLDDALVYAYIFTHTDPEQHEKIRLFDWENIDKEQHGFLKDSLQPHKVAETLKLTENKEVYLPMSVHESGNVGLQHISFTVVRKNFTNALIVKHFDTLGKEIGKNYMKSILNYHPFIVEKLQGASGCGFLTALNAVSYINNSKVICPLIAGKNIEETKKTLIEGFGYKIDENAIDKDGSIKSYPITIYYKDRGKAFEITKDIIEAIQQENKEGTQHGTPPIEHKTITTSFSSFASIGTSSTSTGNLDYKQHQTLITPTPPQKDNTPSQPFQ